MKRGRSFPCHIAGRVRIFHGVNAVNKGFPWYWTDFLENPQHIQDLQDWGVVPVTLVAFFSRACDVREATLSQELTLCDWDGCGAVQNRLLASSTPRTSKSLLKSSTPLQHTAFTPCSTCMVRTLEHACASSEFVVPRLLQRTGFPVCSACTMAFRCGWLTNVPHPVRPSRGHSMIP